MNTPTKETTVAWYMLPAEAVYDELTSSATGLSSAEAARRLAEVGPNELKAAHRISPWAILLMSWSLARKNPNR